MPQIRYGTLGKLKGTKSDAVKYVSSTEELSSKGFLCKIFSLKPSTVYEIEISAHTSAGKGDVVVLRKSTESLTGERTVSKSYLILETYLTNISY